MKRAVPVFIAIGLIVLLLGGFFGFKLIQKYTPTKELSNMAEVYETSGNESAIIFNYELQEARGIFENGQSYLPISWVNENINERFYWDRTENLLVYALPDQIVYATPETKGSNGSPLLLVKEDEVYLTLGLIANYTDFQITAYDKEDVKRIYVTGWGTRDVAQVKKDGKVREKGGIKSPILTEVLKEAEVTVLETMEKWSKVLTADGHMGYIQNKNLREAAGREFKNPVAQPVYGWTGMDEKIVLAWHQVTNMAANDGLEELLKKTRGVNVVSPTWFALTDNNGNYKSLASREYVDKAHAMGLQVWALLDNFSGDVQTEKLLASTSTRKKLIDSLMADVERYNLDGLNMDFEGLKPEAGVHYIQFLRELSIPCREKGVILSVDNYIPTGYNEFYNRKEQGIVADYVIIMGYDEHYAGGEAGSVASISYVDMGISRTAEVVPKERIINAVPFYTRLWTETSSGVKSSALGIGEAKAWVEENQVDMTWDEDLGQYYGECAVSGGRQMMWLEEEESLAAKMNLIKQYDLAGVACWKLGLEDEAAWDSIGWE